MTYLILSAGKVSLTVCWLVGPPTLLALVAYLMLLVVRIVGRVTGRERTLAGPSRPPARTALWHLAALGLYLVLVVPGVLYKSWVIARKAGDPLDLEAALQSAHVLWLPFVPFFLGWLGWAYGLATFGMIAVALFKTNDSDTVRLSYTLILIYVLASYLIATGGMN